MIWHLFLEIVVKVKNPWKNLLRLSYLSEKLSRNKAILIKSENTEITLKLHLFNLGPIPNWTISGSMNGPNMEPVLCNWKKSTPKSNISTKVCT